jgi:Mlc titration factor MtfA (ptsG expression regulator)
MVFGWLKTRRRQRLLAQPFPVEWRETLRRRVRHYQYLPAAQQERVRRIVQVMMTEKEWAGAAGFEVTDEMRVTIAGYAAVMVSGAEEPYFFDRLHTVVIHPDSVRFEPQQSLVNPFLPEPTTLDGVAWERGPVLIAWAAVREERRGRRAASNVVIHEFAHHLDGLNGSMDGVPPMAPESEEHWTEVVDEELAALGEDARRGESSVLDFDARSSPAEFFAVASECFYEQPHALRRQHPDLYAELAAFYRQDPTAWLPK